MNTGLVRDVMTTVQGDRRALARLATAFQPTHATQA
jgi:hypothetical protein